MECINKETEMSEKELSPVIAKEKSRRKNRLLRLLLRFKLSEGKLIKMNKEINKAG